MAFGGSNLGFGVSFNLKDNFSAQAAKIRGSFNKLGGSVSQKGAAMQGAMQGATTAMVGMAAAVGIVTPFVAAIKKASDFGHSINRLGVISRATTEELKQLRQQALDLGDSTEFSAKQAADGMNFLAMAGFNASQTLKAMPQVLDLATIAGADLARTADIASNIMSGFGIEAENLSRVVDVMAATTTSANVDVLQMAESMKLIAPQAKMLGISLEEVSGMVGLLGNNGLQGSIATASMRTAIGRLADATPKAKKQMKAFGIELFDSAGKFKGVVGMVREVEKGLADASPQKKAAALQQIFGRSATQIGALMESTKEVMVEGEKVILKGSEALAAYVKELEGATGAGKRMAAQMRNDFQGTVKALQSRWETMMIKIGDALIPIVEPILKGLMSIIGVISAILDTTLGKFLVGIAFGLAVVVAAMIAWSSVTTLMAIPAVSALGVAINAAIWPVTLIIAAIALIVIGFIKLNKMIQEGSEKMVILGSAILFLMGPIGWIIGGFMLAKRAFKEFNNVGKEGKKDGILGFLQKVGGVFTGVMEIFRSATSEGFALSEKTRDSLKKIGILDFVLALGTWIVRIKEFFKGIFRGFKSMFAPFKKAWDEFKVALDPLFELIGDFFDMFSPGIKKAGGEMSTWATVGEVVGKVLGGVFWVIGTALRGVAFVIGLVVDVVVGLFRVIGWVFSGIWSVIKFVVGGVIDTFMALWDAIMFIWDGITSFFTGIGEFFGLIDEEADKTIEKTINGNIKTTTEEAGGLTAANQNSGNMLAKTNVAEKSEQAQRENAKKGVVTNNTTNNVSEPVTMQVVLDSEVIAESVNKSNEFNDSIR